MDLPSGMIQTHIHLVKNPDDGSVDIFIPTSSLQDLFAISWPTSLPPVIIPVRLGNNYEPIPM
jgi:hypothetical protein